MPDHIIGSWVNTRPIQNKLLEEVYVPGCNPFRNCKFHGHVVWYSNFRNIQAWVWRNHCPAGEIYPLSRLAAPEPSLFALQPLAQSLERPSGPVVSLGNS